MPAPPVANGHPLNPVVVRVERAGAVESVHRGAWCLTDLEGEVLAGAGAHAHPVFVRSAIKSLQALPLVESGAADRFGLGAEELALVVASHNGEPCHVEVVARTLERLGLGLAHLRCGAHPPFDESARAELRARGEVPSVLHNNCSGKHAGFLALARHIDADPADYLAPAGAVQTAVRRAVAELAGVDERTLVPGVDGCSAPTYRLPLTALARAFARLTTPDALPPARRAHARRITAAAAAHPELVGGTQRSLDTALLRASGGRLYAKIGAEGVYALGVADAGRALALKIDDGGARALHALVLGMLERLELATADELARLAAWREPVLRNFAGLEVGRIDAVIA
jgi:L-asparaginase II